MQIEHLPWDELWAEAQRLRNEGRYSNACRLVLQANQRPHDPAVTYSVGLFIKQTRREAWAADFINSALNRGVQSADILALAGSLAQVLGDFERARECLLAAWQAGIDLDKWQVLPALAYLQRYRDVDHPDRLLLTAALAEPRWASRTRAALAFALGKLYDDVGDSVAAVAAWRKAHQWALDAGVWDSARWNLQVDWATQPCVVATDTGESGWLPVLVVGLPRSGTTLVADRLGRHPSLCNRGEMPFLLYVHEQLHQQQQTPERLAAARALWRAHLRQDDAPARVGYIDKNPFNLLALETAFALDPRVRVLWCRRDAADNALSHWCQSFAHADYAYAHRFEDIACVQRDVNELHARAVARWPDRILTVDYEDLVQAPAGVLQRAWRFLGLDPVVPAEEASCREAIGSASIWQARQPVHVQSVGRARHYQALLPELSEFIGWSGSR